MELTPKDKIRCECSDTAFCSGCAEDATDSGLFFFRKED